MDSFASKITIVTGGASGIGAGLCQELAQRGARVVIADINAEGAEALAGRIHASGGVARSTTCDVTEAGAIQRVVDDTLQREGRIDFMFNNAGIGPSGDFRSFSPTDWQAIVDLNLSAIVLGSAAVYGPMVTQGFGHIINTASLGGLIPAPTMALYSATKFAVVGFSTALRAEARAHGVRVSAACPAFVRTRIRETTRARLGPQAVQPLHDQLAVRIEAADCARAILRGVARNATIITVPGYAGLAWWVYRLAPALFDDVLNPLLARPIRQPARRPSVLPR